MALTDNLAAYWKLDEVSGNRADSVGASTLFDNNTVTSAAGKQGNAASFASVAAEYLEALDSAVLSTGDINFTFACWARFTTLAGYPCLASKGWDSAAGPNREWAVFLDSSNNRLWLSVQGSATGGINSTTVISANTWYFVVAWHDATNNQLGISVNNGTPDVTAHATGVQDGTGVFRLGSSATLHYIFHDGLIDEAGFWKRVLTAADRSELFNGGAGITYPFPAPAGGQPYRKRIGGIPHVRLTRSHSIW